ncbi:MAG: hypothetical protein ABEH40_00665 [Haloferacaceae archaeon]
MSRRRRRSALLWGLVGVLTFLVLLGAYWLLVGPPDLPPIALAGTAAGVGAVVTAAAYRYEARVRAAGRRRT